MGLRICRSTKNRIMVRLGQLLRKRSTQAHFSAASAPPRDVPVGHVAISVGSACRRYVVPAEHLNHPALRGLLKQAEDEYGFGGVAGPISLPCDESAFEEAIRHVSPRRKKTCCWSWWRRHLSRWRALDGESQPLLGTSAGGLHLEAYKFCSSECMGSFAVNV